jgi:hypothetical protein
LVKFIGIAASRAPSGHLPAGGARSYMVSAMRDNQSPQPPPQSAPEQPDAAAAARELPPAAQRALAESEERRRRAVAATGPVEVGGRDGPDPARFGDWEKGGIASDF